MSIHTLRTRQHLDRPLSEVFAFFATPENLAQLTPDALDFQLHSTDREMRVGLVVEYRIRPALKIPVKWTSLISDYAPDSHFTDVQVRGPYRRWRHLHRFSADGEGTVVTDEVTYELPFGPIGDLVHRVWVRPRLEQIFAYRGALMDRLLAPRQVAERPLRVAVAGGSGFVGGEIAAESHRRGHEVVVLSRKPGTATVNLPDGVEARYANATTGDGLATALRGVDALVIALAFPNLPMEDPRRGRTFEKVDVEGTRRLVAAARAAGVRRLLYISGAGAAADGERHWFRAKWRAEEAVRGSELAYTIIRPTWIHGPRDVALNRFLGFARTLPFVPLSNFGGQRLAPVFVGDVARLAADALVSDAACNQVFEIGGPETMTMREVIRRALRVAGLRRPLIPAPAPLVKLAAAFLQYLPGRPLTPDGVDFVNQPAEVDLAPLLERMPRRLTPLEEALASYLVPRRS
jgi:NADH dehydrogenase